MKGTEMKGTEMKGIERLLDWVGTLRLSGLVWADEMADELESTVDLIKREHAEDCYKMGLDHGAVWRVVTDMERHVLGHEGMEDSPVARWARELRESLGCADEADEDSEAAVWVRKHGGLGSVQARVDTLQDTLDWLREHAGVGKDELVDYDELLDSIDRRLMPEGYEWPLFEDGARVRCGDEFLDGLGHPHRCTSIELVRGDGEYGACDSFLHWNDDEPDEVLMVSTWEGERVRRPQVLAADGEPLEVGQTVWSVNDGREYKVVTVESPVQFDTTSIKVDDGKASCGVWIRPDNLTHQRPVLDAEGNRIEPAMDVWWVCEGDERGVHAEKLHVESIGDDGFVTCDPFNGGTWVELDSTELYVKKPVLDADGVLIKVGDTVWPKYPYEEPDRQVESAEVVYVHRLGRIDIQAKYATGMSFRQQVDAEQLTHTKPEPRDSWERIEEDKGLNPFDYCKKVGHKLWTFDNAEEVKASDLVRRCKALAERERGE